MGGRGAEPSSLPLTKTLQLLADVTVRERTVDPDTEWKKIMCGVHSNESYIHVNYCYEYSRS